MAIKKEPQTASRKTAVKPAVQPQSKSAAKPDGKNATKPATSVMPNTTGKSGPGPAASSVASNEKVYQLIAETAYFKAKARGFAPGGEVQDWIEAEAEVRRRLGNERLRPR
jgi:hypothetical protein